MFWGWTSSKTTQTLSDALKISLRIWLGCFKQYKDLCSQNSMLASMSTGTSKRGRSAASHTSFDCVVVRCLCPCWGNIIKIPFVFVKVCVCCVSLVRFKLSDTAPCGSQWHCSPERACIKVLCGPPDVYDWFMTVLERTGLRVPDPWPDDINDVWMRSFSTGHWSWDHWMTLRLVFSEF